MSPQLRRRNITRDLVLFVAGLVGLGFETVIEKADRPTLIVAFMAMLGLPTFLNRDERTQPPKDDKDDGR